VRAQELNVDWSPASQNKVYRTRFVRHCLANLILLYTVINKRDSVELLASRASNFSSDYETRIYVTDLHTQMTIKIRLYHAEGKKYTGWAGSEGLLLKGKLIGRLAKLRVSSLLTTNCQAVYFPPSPLSQVDKVNSCVTSLGTCL
jgi:hypothetical protein